jgi:hypothetical protein
MQGGGRGEGEGGGIVQGCKGTNCFGLGVFVRCAAVVLDATADSDVLEREV